MMPSVTRLEAQSAGYSVLELLIMLVILAASAVLIGPRAWATRDAMNVDAAAHGLAAMLVKARADSIVHSLPREVVLDTRRGGYMGRHGTAMTRLGRGIALEASGFLPDASSGRIRVRFKPDGTATGGTIVLRKSRSAVSIAINWLTGSVHVRRLR